MYTISHFENIDITIARLRHFVLAGNTVYVLSTETRDFVVNVGHLDEKSMIALTKLEEGSSATLSCLRTYKTPGPRNETIKITHVELGENAKAKAA